VFIRVAEMDVIHFMMANNVKTLLDIGANVGHFSQSITSKNPNIQIYMLEANPFCEPFLQRTNIPYDIACLSDSEKFIRMYINKNNAVCTGASYYKETTKHYDDAEYVNVNTKLLDDVIFSKFGEYKQFDYIKMDTQGSEIDIIKGGSKTIDQAKYIQIETSLMEYNKGAPLKDAVVEFMGTLGFKPSVLVEKHYWNQDPNDKLIQEDWIFTR
jgi:FkbM family methyltransferase